MNAPRGRPTFKPVAVGATDKVIAGANPKRKGIIICNCDSASTVYLAPNQPAVAGQGIALGPVYDDIELTESDWGQLPGAEWHAVALLAGSVQGPQTPFTASAFHFSTAAVAVADSFTVPAGAAGLLQGASFDLHTGAAGTLQLQLLRGGNLFRLTQITASGTYSVPVALQAGDTVQWAITIASGGGDGDFILSGYTVTLAGAVPSSANVGVIELEG